MDLEQRVDKLEEKVEDLSVLPAKLDILIGLQQEQLQNQVKMLEQLKQQKIQAPYLMLTTFG